MELVIDASDPDLHDRRVATDTGWEIILGLCLDWYQPPSSLFEIGLYDDKLRPCRQMEIRIKRILKS